MLAENLLLTIEDWAYLPVCGDAALDQLLPMFHVYECGAILAGVPTYCALTGWVLTQVLEVAAEITAS